MPADTPEEYYRRAITIPVLDELVGQIKRRFDKHQAQAMKGFSLVPAAFMQNPKDAKEMATQFAEVYADDLPTGNNLVTFKAELEHWELLLEGIDEQSLPCTAVEALRFAQGKLCPSIFQLLLLVSTWPVTTCSCERSVSALRRLKTYLRSTMGQERLSGLALLHTHYGTELDRNKVLHAFVRKNRRILLPKSFL